MTTRTASAAEATAIRLTRQHAADLLARYPDLSPQETGEVIAFLREGTHLEVGLLSSNQAIRPNLDAFMAEHKRALGLSVKETAGAVGGILGFLALCWLAWEFVGPATV